MIVSPHTTEALAEAAPGGSLASNSAKHHGGAALLRPLLPFCHDLPTQLDRQPRPDPDGEKAN
jgi:hypothetical protein